MNYLIREFAQEAEATKKHFPGVWQFYDDELQKFAELLVEKVCYDIMDVQGASSEHIVFVAKQYGVEL